MTRKMQVTLVATVLAVGLLAAVGLREDARLVELGEVSVAPMAVTTTEEGKTRLRNRYLVSAPVAGYVRRVDLEQGDAVAAGQTVAQLEPTLSSLLDPATRARVEAEAGAAADARRAAQSMVRSARAAHELAQRELQRLEAMPADSAVSKSQLDTARSHALQAEAGLAAAIAEQRAAAGRESAARALLSQEGQRGGPTTLPLLAPVGGVLIRRFQESASPVAAGQALVEIGDPTDIEIEVEALSTEAVRLRPGMRARVLRWGGEGELEARVTRIEPGGFTKISALGVEEQRVRVILDLTSPREQWTSLGDAYRVEVEFVLWESDRVLQVPSSALFRIEGQWAVFVDAGGEAQTAAVQIGARGATATEIRAGLDPGQRVVLHPDDRIADGVRIVTAD